MLHWLRKVTLDFDGLKINEGGQHQLTVRFSIDRDISGRANTAKITVINLSESTRNALGKELDHVILRAGYEPPDGGGKMGTLFSGRIRDVSHTRVGTEIETTLDCGDADQALREGMVNRTFPRGTPMQDVVEEVFAGFQARDEWVTRGEWLGLDRLPALRRAETLCGPGLRALNNIGRSHRMYWSFQNERLEVFPSDERLTGYITHISPQTGMVGVPTITDNGVTVKAFIQPEISPGQTVSITSDVLTMNAEGGEYRISKAVFAGDNREGDFFVTITGERIQGGRVDEGSV